MKDSGLGTPATRAGIIETLLKRGYVDRRGRAMVATQRGIDLIASIQVAALKSPELTGSWEATMEQIRRGKAERTVFMAQIRSFVAQLVDGIRGEGQRTAKGHTSALGACPECGSNLYTRTFGERQHISCSALARPDCGYGYDCDASGEPTAGRCPHCQGPRRQDRQGQVTCLRCGRPPVADPQRPAPPPMMNCPQCRQLLRTIWSAKKNQWLLRCGPCNSWVDPPLASQVGDEPKVLPCDRCQAPSMPIWSSQKRAWLWRCTRCVGWGWVVNT
jgi:DNA topoisomerase-3